MLQPTSTQNTDCSLTTDSDDSDQKSTVSYKERRREAHTMAEQKRRDAIKRGYEELQSLVPTCAQQDSVSSYKLSKATILQRSIDYIQHMQATKKREEEELQTLRREVLALQIMKSNYEKIVKHYQLTQPGQVSSQISEEVKSQVFHAIGDSLFQSFDSAVTVKNFDELSAGIFGWLEENCKPLTLKEVVINVLQQLKSQIN